MNPKLEAQHCLPFEGLAEGAECQTLLEKDDVTVFFKTSAVEQIDIVQSQ